MRTVWVSDDVMGRDCLEAAAESGAEAVGVVTLPESATIDRSARCRFDDVAAPVWLLLAYIVVLGTVVPFIFLVSALHHVPATRVTIVAMLEPVLAAIVAWFWLGEELAAVQIAGGLIVLVGVVLAQTSRADGRAEAHENRRKMQKDVAISRPRA